MMYAPRQPFSLDQEAIALSLNEPCIRAQFYRLNNASWLQPMCEYPQNLYTNMNDKQRAVLLPGGWGSTSGPRGGQSW